MVTTLKDIASVEETHRKRIETMKSAIIELIKALPENSDITVIDDRCYTIKKSSLSGDNCLSPTFYRFKAQYNLLIDVINSGDIEHIEFKFKRIIETSKHRLSTHTVRFHPDVIEEIKKLLKVELSQKYCRPIEYQWI